MHKSKGMIGSNESKEIIANSYELLGDTIQESDAPITLTSQDEVMMMWHRKHSESEV